MQLRDCFLKMSLALYAFTGHLFAYQQSNVGDDKADGHLEEVTRAFVGCLNDFLSEVGLAIKIKVVKR